MSDQTEDQKISAEILNFVYSDKIEELLFEKSAIKNALINYDKLPLTDPKMCIIKNSEESKKYRQIGNKFFSKKPHDKINHTNMCKFYTHSIALAPNNSEELAKGYHSRSLILFHLKKFEECINDCDRGIIKNLPDDCLKIKLKYRKIESLLAMKDERLEDVCKDVLVFLQESSALDEVKSKFIKKINDILDSIAKMEFEKTSDASLNTPMNIPDFECQKEAPCASESIMISYNQQWGRHVTATRDIEAGEIIAVEKSCYSFLHPKGMYLHCTNCVKPVLALIPCEHCSHDVYCSEKCKSEAWIKYHQYECPIIPFIWDDFKSEKSCLLFVRFILMSVHEAGGIDKFRNQLMSNVESQDPRTKGFSSDGIFDSSKLKTANSLQNYPHLLDENLIKEFIVVCSKSVYYLATETNFFGIKLSKSQIPTMFENEDVVFIGAIILRSYYTIPYNGFIFEVYHSNNKVDNESHSNNRNDNGYGLSVHSFCNFFNHSCDPNAKYFTSNNNELVVYAKYPILKGSQVFVCYTSDFLVKSKCERQKYLMDTWRIVCECIACERNWTLKTLKSYKTLLKKTPQLRKISKIIRDSIIEKTDLDASILMCDEDIEKELIIILKTLAEEGMAIYTKEYNTYVEHLHKMYVQKYGNWFIEIAEEC